MARIKGAVNAHKKRRKIMKLAKGYYGAKSKQYRAAKEQVMRSLRYAYIGRKLRKRDFRPHQRSVLLQVHLRPEEGWHRPQPQGARGSRRQRRRRVRQACRGRQERLSALSGL